MDNFTLIGLAGAVLVWLAWMWLSIHSRRLRHVPLVPRAPHDALFCERRASGRAHGNMLGHASHCLMVVVTRKWLWITPIFPFNLIAPYGVTGLEYRLPRGAAHAKIKPGLFGRRVVISFRRSRDGGHTSLTLKLKDPDAFVAALQK